VPTRPLIWDTNAQIDWTYDNLDCCKFSTRSDAFSKFYVNSKKNPPPKKDSKTYQLCVSFYLENRLQNPYLNMFLIKCVMFFESICRIERNCYYNWEPMRVILFDVIISHDRLHSKVESHSISVNNCMNTFCWHRRTNKKIKIRI